LEASQQLHSVVCNQQWRTHRTGLRSQRNKPELPAATAKWRHSGRFGSRTWHIISSSMVHAHIQRMMRLVEVTCRIVFQTASGVGWSWPSCSPDMKSMRLFPLGLPQRSCVQHCSGVESGNWSSWTDHRWHVAWLSSRFCGSFTAVPRDRRV